MKRPLAKVYGFEWRKASRLFEDFSGIRERVDYRANTLAWNIYDGHVHTISQDVVSKHRFDALILATGATDRIFPVPGWTKPGVYTLGGAQVALQYQGCARGRRTVFIGWSPLLSLLAYTYRSQRLRVGQVLDQH